MEVVVVIPPSGEITIKAFDLVGDSWQDYLHYMAEAHRAEDNHDLQAKNRALRTALGCLISHLDGVVTGIWEEAQTQNVFVTPQGTNGSLKSRAIYLEKYAANHLGHRVPYLKLHLKPLRDVLVHPSITKPRYDPKTRTSIQLSQKDLFELTINQLDKEGKHIDNWLNSICLAFGYTRFHDTEKICEDLSAGLDDTSEVNRL